MMKEPLMERFDGQGRLVIPVSRSNRTADGETATWVVDQAYCTSGHSLIDTEHAINGYPGIRLAFTHHGSSGVFIISAVAGDFTKKVLSGKLEPEESHDLYCPHCHIPLPVLMPCGCKGKGRLVIIGLSPVLNFNNAITFCDTFGCSNGAFVASGEIIRHARIASGA